MNGSCLRRRATRRLALFVAQFLIGSGLVLAAVAPTTAVADPPRPDPNAGPGGPVLVVTGDGRYGSYLLEIMRGEGLNLFAAADTSALTPGGLASYSSVVLGKTTLTPTQVTTLTNWVSAGGNLVAVRPDGQLASLLGLTRVSGTVGEGYLKVDTSTKPGKGIVGDTMQFHGTADRYAALPGTQVVATLYSDASTATSYPAVTLRSFGSAGGNAAAFTYDLAESVVLTRQGNPAWAGEDRDGEDGVVRSDDLFFGGSQPDYVDLDKVGIPQADEQQRLLANVITETSRDALPLPRFWYLPRGEKAAIVMTSDNHDPQWNYGGSVADRFDNEIAASPDGCSADDWECVRSTSYLFPGNSTLTNNQAAAYQSEGFELALHVTTGCATPTREEYVDLLDSQRAELAESYPALDPSVTNRNHCIAWVDYTSVPEEEANVGVRLDTNYYYWPPGWVNDQPGMFTGSGFPQRFSTDGGQLIDVYQATTQMTDESGQTYPDTAEALLDAALGSEGYYGAFVANVHSDGGTEAMHDDIVDAAQSRQVPVISAEQLLEWTDGRNASSFSSLSLAGRTLTFHVTAASAANGLQAMLPVEGATGPLQALTYGGSPVDHDVRIVKGVQYWTFTATTGTYTATYESNDTTAPTVISQVPASDATGVGVDGAVSVTFSEPVAVGSVTASSVSLSAGSTVVSAALSVSGATVTLTPSANLDDGTVYTAKVTTAVTDLVGNHLAADQIWSFTTVTRTLTPTPTPTITGTVGVGQTLTADEGAWGPIPVEFAYEWLRASTVVGTNRTYTVTGADVGSTVSVRVTGSKVGYASVSRTSDPTVEIATGTLVPATPTIDDTTPEVGQVLTAAEGTWVPAPDSFTYQWLRGSTVVGTARTYVVTAGDVGLTLAVRVTGSKAGYTTTSRTSAATAAVPVLPRSSPNPTITGVARVGMPLTASLGTWNPAPTKVTYQWYRLKSSGARVAIKKATKPAYTPTKAVQSRRLQVRITVSLTGSVATRYSTPTGKVGAPMKARTPKVSDTTPKVGQVLTARTGSWKPARTAFTYQWYARRAPGKATAIVGATGATYQVPAAYAGYLLRVRVTGTAPDYRPVTRTSGYTHKVRR